MRGRAGAAGCALCGGWLGDRTLPGRVNRLATRVSRLTRDQVWRFTADLTVPFDIRDTFAVNAAIEDEVRGCDASSTFAPLSTSRRPSASAAALTLLT